MTTFGIENPQSFVVSTECRKAAEAHGFRRQLDEHSGWASFQSTTAHGTIWLASAGNSGPWYLALDHPGVIEEISLPRANMVGPGLSRFAFNELRSLYAIMPLVYALATSLPDVPLQEFKTKTAGMPRSTEAERLVIQRVGQDIFRDKLLEYWDGKCPLTGITEHALLRASHILPWKSCNCDAQRLDVHNGLLLSALWDAAFDRGLVTFDDDGHPQFCSQISETTLKHLKWQSPIYLTDQHRHYLMHHRSLVFAKSDSAG